MNKVFIALALSLHPLLGWSQIQVSEILDSIYFYGGHEHVGYMLDLKGRQIHYVISPELSHIVNLEAKPKAVELIVFESNRAFYRAIPLSIFPPMGENAVQRFIEKKERYKLELSIIAIASRSIGIKARIGRVHRKDYIDGEWRLLADTEVIFVYKFEDDGKLELLEVEYSHP